MTVVIFGASGATGGEIVRCALERGYSVVAFVRDPSRMAIRSDNVAHVIGDVTDRWAVERAVELGDAVVCVLGTGNSLSPAPDLIEGVRNIIRAMERASVRRLVYLSMLGAGGSGWQMRFLDRYIVVPLLLHNVVAEHEQKEMLIQQSGLDWTIVRPPRMTSGPFTGRYRSGMAIKEKALTPSVARADVADFMVKHLMDDRYVRKAPAVLP